MLSTTIAAIAEAAAEADRPLEDRRRFREIHREAEIAGQAVLDAHPETKGRKWQGSSRKDYEHRPEMNGIHWRIISAAIVNPDLLTVSRTKMLATLSDQFGFTIKRHVIDNPLKRRPEAGTTNCYWFATAIARKLADAGYKDFKAADLKSVETVLKALAKRLLPPPERTMCAIGTIEIDLEGRKVTLLGHTFRLYPTGTGKLRIKGETAQVPLDALLSIVEEARQKGRSAAKAAKR